MLRRWDYIVIPLSEGRQTVRFEPKIDGGWVDYKDYAQLEQQRDRLVGILAAARVVADNCAEGGPDAIQDCHVKLRQALIDYDIAQAALRERGEG